MALKKTLPLDSGFEASYWRVSAVTLSFETQTGQLELTGYKDLGTRSGAEGTELVRRLLPIDTQNFQRFFTPSGTADLLSSAYACVTAQSEFQGATQV